MYYVYQISMQRITEKRGAQHVCMHEHLLILL